MIKFFHVTNEILRSEIDTSVYISFVYDIISEERPVGPSLDKLRNLQLSAKRIYKAP